MSSFRHSDFEKAFTEGHVFPSGQGEIRVRSVRATKLIVVSGEIMAGDPLRLTSRKDYRPFSTRVIPGQYPVWLSVARFDNGRQRVACARARFRRSRPVRWELATQPGEDAAAPEPLSRFGHGVDSGKSCFADYQAVLRQQDAKLESRDTDQEILLALEQSNLPYVWGNVVLDRATGANVVAFTSGWGDGFYASWWGLDEQGRVESLVTDFGILAESAVG